MTRILTPAVILSCAVSAAAAPVPKEAKANKEEYWHFKDGAAYEYHIAWGGNGKVVQRFTVTKEAGAADGETFAVAMSANGGPPNTDRVRVNADGVHRIGDDGKPIDVPWGYTRPHPRVGDRYELQKYISSVSVKAALHVEAEEEVETPAGKFTALRVAVRSPNVTGHFWVARGVGTVKYVISDGSMTMVLGAFTRGK